jgi:hypothetical protein
MKSHHDARKAQEHGDTLPDHAGAYYPPRPVAPLSEHRTMDVKAIRLAAELDPRQAMTMLRLSPPRRRFRISPVTLGSIALLLLAAAGLYLVWLGDAPLPLVASDPQAPAAEPAPADPAVERADLPAAPTSLPTAVRPGALTAQPGVTAAPTNAAPTATSAADDAPSETEPPAEAPRATQPPAPSRPAAPSAPKRSKVSRDPWLE